MNAYKLWQNIKKALGITAVVAVTTTATGMNPVVFEHVKAIEGTVLTAYKDIVGVPTIGTGHTNHVGTHKFKMGDTWTAEYADTVLQSDLQMFWDKIDQQVTVDLTACQHSVLTSWAFNVGTGATGKSTLVRLLNQGQYDAVPAQLKRWDRAGGKRVRGLTRRRAIEADLWSNNCEGS